MRAKLLCDHILVLVTKTTFSIGWMATSAKIGEVVVEGARPRFY